MPSHISRQPIQEDAVPAQLSETEKTAAGSSAKEDGDTVKMTKTSRNREKLASLKRNIVSIPRVG